MANRLLIEIVYTDGKAAEVLLLPRKDNTGYSYVNLTKGHICPCVFSSIDEALADLLNYENIKEYSVNDF